MSRLIPQNDCDNCKVAKYCGDKDHVIKCFVKSDLEAMAYLIRAEVIDEYNKKIDYLKNCYVDACNMCTRMGCDVCAISNFIENLEQLKEHCNEERNNHR